MGKFKRTCKCGCGEVVNLGRKYISGHNRRGKGKKRIYNKCACGCCHVVKCSESIYVPGHVRKGKKHSEETKKKISLAAKGRIIPKWQKKKISEAQLAIRDKVSKRMKENNPSKDPSVVKKILKSRKESGAIKKCSERMKKNNPMMDSKIAAKATKARLANGFAERASKRMKRHNPIHDSLVEKRWRKSMKKIHDRWKEDPTTTPNWKGGIAIEPYCDAWADQNYKKDIMDRDGNKCMNPSCSGFCQKLGVHHINYDKQNCTPSNLLTLCISCNAKANFKRSSWGKFYSKIVRHTYYA
jgi:hypothetical protein